MNRSSVTVLLSIVALVAGCGERVAAPPNPMVPVSEPGWFAAFDGADQQFLFVSRLRRYFLDRGELAEVDADGRLQVLSADGKQHQYFVVAPLADLAASRPADDWPEMIGRHFEAMAALRDAVGEVAVPGWDDARSRLRLRIYPDTFLTEAGLSPDEVVHRVDLPGTRTVLVVDSDQTALVVPSAELRRWQQEADHVLALAFVNTKRALEVEVVGREFPGIGELKVLTGESFYAASAALWIDEYQGLLGEHGAIVAIPWRHGAFVYPFDDARVQTVVPALYRYAERIVQDSAGPIGTRIWWRRVDGSFAPIDIEEVDGQLEILPPRDLAELLSSMK